MNDRPNKRTRGLIIAACLWLATYAASESRAETQLYDIELVVFQNLVANDGGEVWPPDYSAWSEIGDGHNEPESGDASSLEVTWLSGPYRLAAHYEALRRSAQYRPLAHVAWRQPVLDREQADVVHLPPSGARAGGAYVDGSARVAVERYLHLSLDLQLHSAAPRVFSADAELESQPPAEIRLRETRRMRSKELHYFDNPRFGVLALITPFTPSEPGSETLPDDPRPQDQP